ncbi:MULTISPECIES: SDR family NAD(P)-dependent oxidoreductase [unclassified Streptomyces]|uniref:SDR family NAD(P)-dependent oxidoreductase n=1 Tax=unclassified Streptomyces TaxID=2593676 RepID=UPI002E2A1E00|nr:SDR family NAD(P)-dependent oxidoreductase [Streptomyces sp. NBC_00190]
MTAEPRIVLITGATSGLGRHLAEQLADQGDTILVHGRDAGRVDSCVQGLRAAGAAAHPYVADLARLDEVRALSEQILAEQPRIDVLINNAGVGPGPEGAERQLSDDAHELRFAVNYLAPVLLTRLLLPGLRNARSPRVVNVGSAAQLEIDFDDLTMDRFYHGWVAYGRSKLALASFSTDLAAELAGEHIPVNCVHPANFMPTPMVQELGIPSESTIEQGAEAVLRLACATGDTAATGGYYDGVNAAPPHQDVLDPAKRALLGETSEEILASHLAAGSDFRTHVEKILAGLETSPAREALVHRGRRTTALELRAMVFRMARALRRQGVDRRQTVTILSGTRPEALAVRFAAGLVGCRVHHLNNSLTAETQAAIVQDIETHTLIVDPGYGDRAEELTGLASVAQVLSLGPSDTRTDLLELAAQEAADPFPSRARPQDICVFNYTGGTTGRPKGIAVTYEEISGNYTAPPAGGAQKPRLLMCTPLMYTGGVMADVVLMSEGTVVLHDGFDAGEVLAAIERERITHIFLVPPMPYQLVDHPASVTTDTSSMRTVMYAGCRASASRLADVVRRFGPVLVQSYGQNEAGGISVLASQDHDPSRPGVLSSAGRPLPWVTVAIRDEAGRELPPLEHGEICVRSKTVMRGYWKQPDESDAVLKDGWLHTGDIGFLDSNGYLTVTDRARDMINVASDHIYPSDLEDLLNSHHLVADSAVFGVLGDDAIEHVHAVVVPVPGETINPQKLLEMVREAWGEICVPIQLGFTDSLPRTGAGKPDKQRLKALASTRKVESEL